MVIIRLATVMIGLASSYPDLFCVYRQKGGMINDFIIFDFGLSRTVTADESAPHLVADGGGNEMTILENRGYNAAANDADLHRRPNMYEGCRKSTISSIGGEMNVEPKLRRRDDGLIESSIRLTPPLSLTPAKRPHTSYSWPATTSPPRRFESKRSPNYGLTNSPPRFEYEQENHLPMFENSNDAYLQDEASVTTTLLSDHEEDLMNLCANRSGTTGLCNLGNTCFMNAALQCLVHTSYLADFFLSRNCDIFLSDEKLGRSFAEVIENIYQNRYMTYSPDSFLREFTADNVAPQFGDGEQRKCFTLLGGHLFPLFNRTDSTYYSLDLTFQRMLTNSFVCLLTNCVWS